jgi:xanthine/uracil permease
MPQPKQPSLLARALLRLLDWFAVLIGVVIGAFLAMAWGSLDGTARLAVAALALLAIAGHLTIRRARRRKVRS